MKKPSPTYGRKSPSVILLSFFRRNRSADGQVHRFHKGAFYIAEKLQLDIIPLILYGPGMVVTKLQPFYVKHGILSTRILPRIHHDDPLWGSTYQERTKKIAAYFREKYKETCDYYAKVSNPYYYHKLIKNYIYKGPVEEWYIRIKVNLEHKYEFFDRIIPRKAQITDIGCGFGPLAYMLMMLSEGRTVLGIDYDEEK